MKILPSEQPSPAACNVPGMTAMVVGPRPLAAGSGLPAIQYAVHDTVAGCINRLERCAVATKDRAPRSAAR
jgi:hypothetical protein